jgi:predicted enzyme related to lactoylglutathione lyase
MNRVVHFEIHADDVERAKKFYTDVFGWETQQMGEETGNYILLKSGPGPDELTGGKTLDITNVGINGGMLKRNAPKPAEGMSPMAYVCTVGVPDIDATIEKIKAAGGNEHMPKIDVPGVGKLGYWADTEGNIFGILQPQM